LTTADAVPDIIIPHTKLEELKSIYSVGGFDVVESIAIPKNFVILSNGKDIRVLKVLLKEEESKMYEYAAQEKLVVNKMASLMVILSDNTPDTQQMLQIIAEVTAILAPIKAVMDAETKAEFRMKFWAMVGADMTKRALNQFIPDEPNV
jgi:hypothetical protein